jgi:hypothetical protein
MPGENTAVKRWVDNFRRDMESRKLPDLIQNAFELFKSRSGREFTYGLAKNGDVYQGTQEEDDTAGLETGYLTLVVHDNKIHSGFFEKVMQIYQGLNFTKDHYSPENIEKIDLSPHLTLEMKIRLGYQEHDNIPGYRYRIKTTPDYVDSDHAGIGIDLILPIHASSCEMKKDTPVFFILPRPEKAYYIESSLGYKLNTRMMRRLFKKETGHNLLIYYHYPGRLDEYYKANPFYNVEYHPFKNSRSAFVIDPELEFPEWKGEPLPKLFDK